MIDERRGVVMTPVGDALAVEDDVTSPVQPVSVLLDGAGVSAHGDTTVYEDEVM